MCGPDRKGQQGCKHSNQVGMTRVGGIDSGGEREGDKGLGTSG